MDRLVTIISYQWRSYWRQIARGGRLNAGNQVLTAIVASLVLLKYAQLLRLASNDLARGRTSLLEALLVGISFAWVFYFSGRERNGEGPRRLRHLPLSINELFGIRAVSVMMPPYAWLLLGGSLAICYPIMHARQRLAGMIAALLFIGSSWLAGITTAHLLSISWWRKMLGIAALVLAVGVAVLVANKSWSAPMTLSAWLPTRLVGRIAVAEDLSLIVVRLAMLGVLAGVNFLLARLSFRQSLEQSSPHGSAQGGGWQLSLPGRLGGLIVKDLRYFRRLLDIYLGLLVAGAGCFYLATVDVASRDIYLIFLTFLFLPNSPLAFNCFGLDSVPGLDRYTLLPLGGGMILLSKNLAFTGFVGMQAAPLLLLASWRLGATDAVLGLIAMVSLACAYMAWGNWMSVSHPIKMQFFRFSSSSSAILDAMAGIIFSTAPGILIIYLLHFQQRSLWTIAVVPLFFGALYFLSLWRFGLRFQHKLETIARALA